MINTRLWSYGFFIYVFEHQQTDTHALDRLPDPFIFEISYADILFVNMARFNIYV